jgi:hypothetical protein
MRYFGSSLDELSAEQILQCTPLDDPVSQGNYGCKGGDVESAFQYVESVKGVVYDKDYPYTSYDGTTGHCDVDTTKAQFGIYIQNVVAPGSEVVSFVQTTGPLNVGVDATNWNTYTGGVMTPSCSQAVNAFAQAVGMYIYPGDPSYLKVRNSWGTGWGESGFIRLGFPAGNYSCLPGYGYYTSIKY